MITFKKKPDSVTELKQLLEPSLKKWFFNKFEDFSLPQAFALMEVHSRNNVLVCAPTGATKTLTSFLSILNELIDSSKKGILEDRVYAIYVSPLKALNYDIEVNLNQPLKEIEEIYGKELGIRVMSRTGDTTQAQKTQMLKKPPHILVTTPESLSIVLSSKKFSEHLKKVEWFIVDEIHSLAENKRGVDLSIGMERLARYTEFCRIGLSATVEPIEEIAQYLVGSKRDCKIVDVRFIKDIDIKVLSPVPDLVNTTYERIQEKTYELINDLVQKHKTTLIFTNTRSATERVVHTLKTKHPKLYYEINENPPYAMSSLIGAHHGSLSKESRFEIEKKLREGKLKCVSCSTSLELGIDIGYIDLVILLGSPKSVARALQRVGRSGHQLKSVTKGRIIVTDRDDLVECSVLLKNAIEKKIDRVHIPRNSLDVLAQGLLGIIIDEPITREDAYELLKKSYCYSELSFDDFNSVVEYLLGGYAKLEERRVYSKIREKEGILYPRGMLIRPLYMSNVGTIVETGGMQVRVGDSTIGTVEESFIESLKKGDVFVLGGDTYEFNHAKGMVAFVKPASGKKPNVPSWFSQMLPLSFDLANDIQRFRKLMSDRFEKKESKEDIVEFINKYLYVDNKASEAIYNYFFVQYEYNIFPTNQIMIENYYDEEKHYAIFHSLNGRRVNDALSRMIAYTVARLNHVNVEIGINDNGFYLASNKKFNAIRAFELLKDEDVEGVLKNALENSEILKRRFRMCAERGLMILKNYMGKTKSTGKSQVSSVALFNAARGISDNFPIIKEARREVSEDLMDIKNVREVIKRRVNEFTTTIPSPFAFNIIMQNYADILTFEDRQSFLKNMQAMVLAKIGQKKTTLKEISKNVEVFNYDKEWDRQEKKEDLEKIEFEEEMIYQFKKISKRIGLDPLIEYDLLRLLNGETKGFRIETRDWLKNFFTGTIPKIWSTKLVKHLKDKYKAID